MSYKATYDAAKLNPEKFWMEAAEKVDWITPPSKALFDDNAPFYEWFSDAEVNTCFNAVDRHVIAGNGKQTAIIYDSPITGKKSKISYLELKEKTAKLGGLLKSQGVKKGDRIIIYMPMIPEAIITPKVLINSTFTKYNEKKPIDVVNDVKNVAIPTSLTAIFIALKTCSSVRNASKYRETK